MIKGITPFMWATLAAAYVGSAIATFGYVYNHQNCIGSNEIGCSEYRVASGLIAGMFWPMTVSAILQESDAIAPCQATPQKKDDSTDD